MDTGDERCNGNSRATGLQERSTNPGGLPTQRARAPPGRSHLQVSALAVNMGAIQFPLKHQVS